VWVLLQGQARLRKILSKSACRAYVRFEDGPKAVKYYNAETRKVLISRNFSFPVPQQRDPSPEEIVVAPNMPREGESRGSAQPSSANGNSDSSKRKRDGEEDTLDLDSPRKTRGRRTNYRYLADPFSDEEEDETNELEELSMLAANAEIQYGGDEPKSLKEAQQSPDWPEWEHAIKAELAQLHEKGMWTLVRKPADAVPITNKWVFTKKYNSKGDLLKYKARLVVKGCAQRPGYDYVDTFAPVVCLETLRIILAMSVVNDLHIGQMDVKGAYLNGILKERVYMRQPEGYDDESGRACQLVKTLYGLKQSGREWNRELDEKLRKRRFKRLRSDPCAYIRQDGEGSEIVTVWVDDLMLFASSAELNARTKAHLRAEWEMTDMGEPTKIVGIEITRSKDAISISQKRYVENILKQQGMQDANPVGMPMDPNIKLEPNPDGGDGNRSNSFAKLLGELQFLANATRPDIAYAVNRLASYTANPSLQHSTALKRILRYLAGTRDYGITYRKPTEDSPISPNAFYGFADAAYANTDDYKSTSGYVFLASGGAVSWRLKKQTTIALSSTEAEYVALSEAGREASWLRSLHDELGDKQNKPTLIKGDNDGSIAMARNPQFHKRSKHIATRWHWVRDLVEDRALTIESCRDPQQTADVLTKALPKPKHQRHTQEMGLAPI
jgi:hypothetical protein